MTRRSIIPQIRPGRLLKYAAHIPTRRRRLFSTEAASHLSSKVQCYISRSNDPYVNLSLEHHLLQKSPPDSAVLLLYTNRPCIVIGRNQNPWLEVNLPLVERLRSGKGNHPEPDGSSSRHGPVDVQLVRRRSGGGTVFHDLGNVNYSVICPPAKFHRNKHAEMVVRALHKLGAKRARVNTRHDIVVDVDAEAEQTFKVSGSAFKLTRLRALHHGTCLLSSPNLPHISPLLRSPAEPFIKARGVESVRSRVANLGLGNDEFEDAVRREFGEMYGRFDVDVVVGDTVGETDEVRKGVEELHTREWIYGQTPRFRFSTAATEDDPRDRPALPFKTHMQFEAKHGIVEELAINGTTVTTKDDDNSCQKPTIYDNHSWTKCFQQSGSLSMPEAEKVGHWLEGLLGAGQKPDV